MRRDHFRNRLSRVDALTETQRLRKILSGRGEATAAALELDVDEERRCPCHDMSGSHGKARGLRRCGKGWTFNALTPLSRLRHGKRRLSFDESMARGETLKEVTERFAVTVAAAPPFSRSDGSRQAERRCRRNARSGAQRTETRPRGLPTGPAHGAERRKTRSVAGTGCGSGRRRPQRRNQGSAD